MYRDRKRKKFVSDTGKDVKKIKTESGAKIPASYKADLYPHCLGLIMMCLLCS